MVLVTPEGASPEEAGTGESRQRGRLQPPAAPLSAPDAEQVEKLAGDELRRLGYTAPG